MLVLKYFWQVIRRFKISFFTIIILSVVSSFLDIYIPLKYLKLWDVLNTNDFSLVSTAKSLIILILLFNFSRWALRRAVGYTNDYFQTNVMEGLRKQAFSYMIGHSHNFFANNFGGSLTYRVNKYARAFERLMDRFVDDGMPLVVRSLGTIIAIYTLMPKYSYILTVFSLIFLITALVFTKYKLKYDVIAAESDSKTTGALSDSISNHSSIQLFAGHEYENIKVGKVIESQKKATVFNLYLWETLGAIQSFYILAIEFVIFWLAIGDWRAGLIGVPVIVVL